jgi:hypothetical protein
MLREADGLGARALRGLGLSLDDVRARVERLVPAPAQPPQPMIPFTPLAKKVLELALRQALKVGHNDIGAEHILLGLVDVKEGLAVRILSDCGVGPAAVGARVNELLSGPPTHLPSGGAEVSVARVRARGAPRLGHAESVGSAASAASGPGGAIVPGDVLSFLGRVAGEIRAGSGREPDVADYLLALASLPGSLHAQVLAELKIDVGSLHQAIERARRVTGSPLGGLAPDEAVARAWPNLGLGPREARPGAGLGPPEWRPRGNI